MKKILSILLIGILTISLTGCGGSSANVPSDLTKVYDECLAQNDKSTCMMNWTFQKYLETYTSYRLLNTSKQEFTVKPQEPNSLFTYGASRDAMCDYNYALFYNKDNNTYYSVKLECEDHNGSPKFASATNLDNGKVDVLPNNEKQESSNNKEENKGNNTVDNTTNNNVDNNSNNTAVNSSGNTDTTSNEVEGLKIGNITIKYGTYEGQDAASGIELVIKKDGSCTYEGKNGTYTLGKHDFAQDISSQGHPVDCIIIKTDYTYYLYPENSKTLTDGGINTFTYLEK